MINWMPYFLKELEKNAFIGNAIFGAMYAGDVMAGAKKNRLQSLKQMEPQMQLPASSNIDVSGSKRLDPHANSAEQRF